MKTRHSSRLFLVLVAILLVNSTFCQLIRVINKDTVVVMTIKDAKEVNESFKSLRDSINIYKIDNEQIISDFTDYQIRINREIFNCQQVRDSVYGLYITNKKIYEYRERDFRKERTNQQIFTMLTMVITILLAIK
jgi:hypothetical protein